MPAQRDEPSAPPQAENDVFERIVVALRATGRLVPAVRRGMSLPYGGGLNCYKRIPKKTQNNDFMLDFFCFLGIIIYALAKSSGESAR